MKINEDNYYLISETSAITNKEYEINWYDAENIDGYISENELEKIIEDLVEISKGE